MKTKKCSSPREEKDREGNNRMWERRRRKEIGSKEKTIA